MIYEFSNFVDNFNHADGNTQEKMAITQFSKILGSSPDTIKVALEDADIQVPQGATKGKLIELIQKNSTNKKLKTHLGTIMVVQAEQDNFNLFGTKTKGVNIGQKRWGTKLFKGIGNMFKKKGAKSPTDGTTTMKGGTEKKGFFKNLFGSRKNKDGTKKSSVFGSWFNKNSDSIANIGGSLIGGLFGGGKSAEQQSNTYSGGGQTGGGQQQGGGGKGGMMKKIMIGVGVLVLIGGIVWLVRRK
jgi:hypothetical protein